MRTACYIDGFNLYHAVEALAEPALKWANLASLASSYARPGDVTVRTVFFTALSTWDVAKRGRHLNYIKALQHLGVEVVLSRFDKVRKHCHQHDWYCSLREEKQTDVSIAISMLTDCYEQNIERIVLMTADSDQVPAVKAIKARFPDIVVFMVAPPGRLKNARELSACCDGFTEMTKQKLVDHRLPVEIRKENRELVAARPAIYGDRFLKLG